jgi:hypothetical protein
VPSRPAVTASATTEAFVAGHAHYRCSLDIARPWLRLFHHGPGIPTNATLLVVLAAADANQQRMMNTGQSQIWFANERSNTQIDRLVLLPPSDSTVQWVLLGDGVYPGLGELSNQRPSEVRRAGHWGGSLPGCCVNLWVRDRHLRSLCVRARVAVE